MSAHHELAPRLFWWAARHPDWDGRGNRMGCEVSSYAVVHSAHPYASGAALPGGVEARAAYFPGECAL